MKRKCPNCKRRVKWRVFWPTYDPDASRAGWSDMTKVIDGVFRVDAVWLKHRREQILIVLTVCPKCGCALT